MKNLKYILVLTMSFVFGNEGLAQNLSLGDAIQMALSNNHEIVFSTLQDSANQKNVHAGAVGYYPKVDVNSSASYSSNISDQEFATNAFPDIVGMEAASSNQTAQVSVSYLIFNGFARSRSYSKLKQSGLASELQAKIAIESTLLQVVDAYYSVVSGTEQLRFLENNLTLSAVRLKRIESKYSYGSVGKIEVLNAQVDFNNDSIAWMNGDVNLKQMKNQLNFLLGRPVSTPISTSNEIDLPILEAITVYQNKTKENSTAIILAETQLSSAELDKKINQSSFLPIISSQLNYGYSGSANEVGIIQKSSSVGYTAALSLSWNLFDGMKKKKAVERAKILINSNAVKKEQAILKVDLELSNYYASLESILKQIQLQSVNLELAQLNVDRSKELFFNGTITSLQFRQSQLNLLQIQNNINLLQYQTKKLEYQILRLTGELVK